MVGEKGVTSTYIDKGEREMGEIGAVEEWMYAYHIANINLLLC